jgi:PIN domain nuclease of toxin-antitoxin system
MRFLLDTHVFLWIFSDLPGFKTKVKQFFYAVDENAFYLSDASVWEASIKYGSGKLKLPEDPEQFFTDRVRRAGYKHLSIDLRHVATVHILPLHHRDPFDRLLVSQARIEDMTVISDDPVFGRYDIKTLTTRDIC